MGNGFDTHRLWESLYLGSIPVTKFHKAYEQFQDLPIIFIENWKKVNLEFLNITAKKLPNQSLNKLTIDYWELKIKNMKLNTNNYYQYSLNGIEKEKIVLDINNKLLINKKIKTIKTFLIKFNYLKLNTTLQLKIFKSYYSNMKIFITGIAGFLGGHIAENLLEKGYEVSGCDNLIGGYIDNVPEQAEFFQVDAIYLNQMKKMTKNTDVIIHTACTAYEGLSVFSPYLVGQNTYQISMSTFTAAAQNNVGKVINCSSMARYGQQEKSPFTEDMLPLPQDPYGIAKLASEETLKF